MQEPVSPLAGAPSATVLPVDGHRLVHDEQGLLLYVQVGPAADDTLNAVRSLLRRHPEAHQLRGRSLRVDFGEHLLDTVAMRRLVVLLRMEYGVSVAGVRCSPGALQRFAEQVFQTRVRFSGGALEMAQFEGPMSSLDGLDPMIWAALLPAPTPVPEPEAGVEPVAEPEASAPVVEAQIAVAIEVVSEGAAESPAADGPVADAPAAPQALVEANVHAAVVEVSAPIAPASPAPVPAQAAEPNLKAGGKRGRRRGAKAAAAEPALSIPAVAPTELAAAQEPTAPVASAAVAAAPAVALDAAPAVALDAAATSADLGSGVADVKPVEAAPEAPVPPPAAGSPALAPAADPAGDAEDDQLELGEAEDGDGELDVGDAILAVTDLSVAAPSTVGTAPTATEAAEPRRLGEQQPAWHREGDRRVLAVSRTLRSGAIVRFPGDVVVYGDVNAGAHIEAGGNIIVLGALRGLAHAGAQGDTAAVVLGFDLKPAQLRIADHIAFPEGSGPARASGLLALFQRDRSAKGAFAPVVALVRDGHIVLEDYRGRLPG